MRRSTFKLNFGLALSFILITSLSAQANLIYRGHLPYSSQIPKIDQYPEEVAIFSGMKGPVRSGYDLIIHLHGYRVVRDTLGHLENFDDVLQEFDFDSLLKQSGRNAVVAIPSSLGKCDTYASHLVPEIRLNYFMSALLNKLGAYPNRIILVGHSGAYRALASLSESFVQDFISELYLLDADYGENDAFAHFIQNPKHRFISVYRKDTSTALGSYQLWQALHSDPVLDHPTLDDFYRASYSTDVSAESLPQVGATFISTSGDHWKVVNDFWSRVMKTTGLKQARE